MNRKDPVMQLLDSVGDRSVAVQEYEASVRRLEEELELDPAPETHALLEGIRERSKDAQPQPHQTPVAGGAETPAPGAERWEDARVLYHDLAAEFPDNVNFQGFLGTIAARSADRDEALRISRR